jgi:hypothetical protein
VTEIENLAAALGDAAQALAEAVRLTRTAATWLPFAQLSPDSLFDIAQYLVSDEWHSGEYMVKTCLELGEALTPGERCHGWVARHYNPHAPLVVPPTAPPPVATVKPPAGPKPGRGRGGPAVK